MNVVEMAIISGRYYIAGLAYLSLGFSHKICIASLTLRLLCDLTLSIILKQLSLQASLQGLELCRCLNIREFFSVPESSRIRVEVCRHVSPAHTELHPAHANGAEYLDTECFTLTNFLILKEENANLIVRLLQYLLINLQTLYWAQLEKERYSSLK